jgi:hypothetical protein
MLSLAPGARTGVDGHTPAPNVIFEFEFEFELLGNSWQFMANHVQDILRFLVIFGLDTAGERRLLDQRITTETNGQVARLYSNLNNQRYNAP